MKYLVVTAALVLLAGCASLNESECLTADWHLIGFEDGAKGQPASRIGEHRSACAEYGVVPDYQAYKAGHNEGVREYCTPSRGFQLGKDGGHYNGICPDDLELDFLDSYELGKVHYGYLREISQYDSEINRSETRIKKLLKKVRSKETVLISDDTGEQRRAELLAQIKEHQREIGELEAIIFENERMLAVAEAEYQQLQQPPYNYK